MIFYFILAVAGGGLVAAVSAGIWAAKSDGLFPEDFGTVLLPPAVLFFVGGFRDTQFAALIWPIVAAVFLMYLFGLKVTVIDRLWRNARRNSKVLFYAALACATVWAMTMPTWPE